MSHYDCPCMEKCPLHYAMSVIGGKWTVQIVCALTNAGALRYNALRAKLDGISNTVLATSLRELEADGLVVRTVYPEVPVRVEYRPTEDCRVLLPILEQLSDWAEARMAAAQPSEATLMLLLLGPLYWMPNRLFPFYMVSRASSSVVMPLIWASFSAM